MRPIKWIRKNRNKLMAGFVVIIMGAFILGDMTCRQLTQFQRNPAIAYYGDSSKITVADRTAARGELDLLKRLFAPEFLASQQDVNLQLLGQLLFFQAEVAEGVSRGLKRAFGRSGVPVSDAEIDEFFRQVRANEVDTADLWILLNAEADKAGVASSNEEATQILSQVIPQILKISFHDYLTVQINRGTSEETLLQVYSKLIKVFRYAQLKTAQELVTTNQLKSLVKRTTESIDPNLVRIDADVLVDANSSFPAEQLAAQFDSFKSYHPGDYTEANPYGFGYRLPSRVQLEYLAVSLDDVRKVVAKPSVQEMQSYYQQNTSRFTEQVPDPADPNDREKTVSRTRSYSEVADEISRWLYEEKVQTKARAILDDAARFVERSLEEKYVENLSDARYKELCGDYEEAAIAITEKHGVKLYAGRTGMLSADDFAFDLHRHTGSLYFEGRNGNIIPLRKIAFAVGKLDGVELGPFDMTTPRMYETFGPLSDTVLGRILALVRVVDAVRDEVPAGLDTTYSRAGIRLDEPASKEDVYSVEESVTRDVRLVAAMSKAEAMAAELGKLDPASDWQPVLQKWNATYATPKNLEPFKVQSFGAIRRPSAMDLWMAIQRIEGLPDFVTEKARQMRQYILAGELFGLLNAGETAPARLPAVVKYEPGPAFLVIKTMSLNNVTTTRDYEQEKALGAYFTDMVQGQTFAFVHFSPHNIKGRTAYRQWASRDLAVAIEKVTSGDYSSEAAPGGAYVDPVGGRFSVAVSEGLTEEHGFAPSTYTVPRVTKDGQTIPMGGQKLEQSIVRFRSADLTIEVQVRQSYWNEFDRDVETIRAKYDQGIGKVEYSLTRMDGVRAAEVVALDGKDVIFSVFFKKDGFDHLITVTCAEKALAAKADGISQFLRTYRSITPDK